MRHQPFTILLHIALAIILVGAFVTHFSGIQGIVILHEGEQPTRKFEKESGPGDGTFPFAVALERVAIDYYPATTTPMDFHSVLKIDGNVVSVAMNRVGVYDGWRFYQSGIGEGTSTLSVSHDPWGTGITYLGYILLGIGMVGFFFQRNTPWRALLKRYRKGVALAAILAATLQVYAAELPTMQRPLAANLGKTLVYWNDRVCPVQTMARDIAVTLYGSESYKGFTPEQILSGWLFYYDQWQRDFLQSNPELNRLPPYPTTKKEKKLAEKAGLVKWIGTGEIFRIYPYKAVDGHMEWLSLTGRKPSGMPLHQWTYMQTAMPKIKELLQKGRNIAANDSLSVLIAKQREFAVGVSLPSPQKINAERCYNAYFKPLAAGITALIVGLVLLIIPGYRASGRRYIKIVGAVGVVLVALYVASGMGLIWWISGHLPLSNGPETMMFLALVSLMGAICLSESTVRGALSVIGGMALMVAAMGSRTPQIGAMMPVLASPLLSIHVMVIMVAYAMFLLTAILSITALCSKSTDRRERLGMLNRIILTPAVCLLGAGIFIGAVWANQTWGRYWGWDPKETCALVMWLIYALPLHWGSRPLKAFRNPKVLHIYLLVAILSVIFTYFGANYFLTGLHSYA